MGAGNVKAVIVQWGHLPHAPFRLLITMAVTVPDNDPKAAFWGGREMLALGLGMPADADSKTKESFFQQVKRHTASLVKAGAIKCVRAAGAKTNAEYQLAVSMERGSFSDPQPIDGHVANGGRSGPPMGVAEGRNGGRSATGMGVVQRPPEDYRGEVRTEVKDEVVLKSVPHDRARRRSGRRSRARDDPKIQQQALWPSAVPDVTQRCPDCRATHTGWTCQQYRDGEDLREGDPDGQAQRPSRRRRSAV